MVTCQFQLLVGTIVWANVRGRFGWFRDFVSLSSYKAQRQNFKVSFETSHQGLQLLLIYIFTQVFFLATNAKYNTLVFLPRSSSIICFITWKPKTDWAIQHNDFLLNVYPICSKKSCQAQQNMWTVFKFIVWTVSKCSNFEGSKMAYP